MKNLWLSLILLIPMGCVTDFRPDDKFLKGYERKVVVNSILNPDSTIRVNLSWSRFIYDSDLDITTISGADVEIYEEDRLIYEGVTDAKGYACVDYYPKGGKNYSLVARVEGQPEITASTSIPENSSVTFTNRAKRGGFFRYLLYDVSSFVVPKNARAIWIRGADEYEDGYTSYSHEFYANNAFLDPINTAADATDAYVRESNLIYEHGFIRIPGANVTKITPFTFSVWVGVMRSVDNPDFNPEKPFDPNNPDDPETNPSIKYMAKYARLYIITPSDEFDKYSSSAYKQWLALGNEMPLAGEASMVYSNITNGLGVFAGYNSATFKTDSSIYLDLD